MDTPKKKQKIPKNPVIDMVQVTGHLAVRVGAKKLRRIYFKRGVNILCGPNGSGKSTTLNAVFPRSKKSKNSLAYDMDPSQWGFDPKRIKIAGTPGCMVRRFDFEKNNPRTSGHNAFYSGNMGLWAFGRSAEMLSHGEAQKKLMAMLLNTEKDAQHCVMLLDEPEQALDFDGLALLKKSLAQVKSVQFIIATHSPSFILDPSYNVIELVEGYREKIRHALVQILAT